MQRSELEKMLSGDLYDANDPNLKHLRLGARALTYRFNLSEPGEQDERQGILEELLGGMGDHCHIEPPFYCDYGRHIFLGDHCYMNFNCIILDCARVEVGDQVMFGPGVHLYAASHPLDASERSKGLELAAPIHIGRRAWLGGGVLVCQGVEIGENTTIGAGSVVTKSIPPNVFAAGNPCKVIRTL
ncbi:MAG: sugar O-acetyltransferase [Saprospiraceae bacterium]|nr:sugar O-acetyltransferase [Saprospiraceae bacterium]